jgi:hypothetical protein
MDWLDRLVADHGPEIIGAAMSAAWTADPNVKDFLGRVQMVAAKETKRRNDEAAARRAKSELEYQRSLQAEIASATPEEQARAAEISAGIKSFLKGVA